MKHSIASLLLCSLFLAPVLKAQQAASSTDTAAAPSAQEPATPAPLSLPQVPQPPAEVPATLGEKKDVAPGNVVESKVTTPTPPSAAPVSAAPASKMVAAKKVDFNQICTQFEKELGGQRAFKGQVPDSVCVVMMPRPIKTTILGLNTQSPLVNCAMFSTEMDANGQFINLGEGGFLDSEVIPLQAELTKAGIITTAIHTHWLDTTVNGKPTTIMYYHWMKKGDPIQFAKDVAAALKKVLK